MRDLFYVGQRVRVKTDHADPNVRIRGLHATIITQRYHMIGAVGLTEMFAYTILVDGFEHSMIAEEWELEPIYDGDQKTSWEDCAWRPRDLVTPTP